MTMPNPVAEVVERLREAADNIERARMSGIVENLAGWEQRAVREAAECIAHLNAERLSRERDTGVPEGFVLVPNTVLSWLFGEGPDANGNYFGDEYAYDFESGRYWWRSELRAMLAAAPQPPTVSPDIVALTRERDQAREALAELQTDLSGVVDNHLDKTEGWIGRELRAKDLPTWWHKVNDVLEKSRARSVLHPEKEEKA